MATPKNIQKYRESHKEEYNGYHREYYAKNKRKVMETQLRHLERKLSAKSKLSTRGLD